MDITALWPLSSLPKCPVLWWGGAEGRDGVKGSQTAAGTAGRGMKLPAVDHVLPMKGTTLYDSS